MTNPASTIDRTASTVSFRRTLRASPDEVFDAWTQADQLTAWWDPTGTPLEACEIDLRVGGTFRFVNDGHGPPFEGVYRVIDRPRKLEFDAMGATGTVEIAQEGDATTLHVTIRCASPEHLEQMVKLGVHEGTARTLDNLVSHLGPRGGRHEPPNASKGTLATP